MQLYVMKEQIFSILKSLVADFPDHQIELLFEISKLSTINQNDYFISEGQTPRKFGFITKGLVRYSYSDNEGREFTKAFLGENSFISSYTAMKKRTQSPFSIQALSKTEIIEIDYYKWETLRQKNVLWNEFLIALLEKGYSIKEKREKDFLLFDAENRYKIFREEFFMLEPLIKQHIIASYIGITPIALSRIRRKMGLINLC